MQVRNVKSIEDRISIADFGVITSKLSFKP